MTQREPNSAATSTPRSAAVNVWNHVTAPDGPRTRTTAVRSFTANTRTPSVCGFGRRWRRRSVMRAVAVVVGRTGPAEAVGKPKVPRLAAHCENRAVRENVAALVKPVRVVVSVVLLHQIAERASVLSRPALPIVVEEVGNQMGSRRRGHRVLRVCGIVAGYTDNNKQRVTRCQVFVRSVTYPSGSTRSGRAA